MNIIRSFKDRPKKPINELKAISDEEILEKALLIANRILQRKNITV